MVLQQLEQDRNLVEQAYLELVLLQHRVAARLSEIQAQEHLLVVAHFSVVVRRLQVQGLLQEVVHSLVDQLEVHQLQEVVRHLQVVHSSEVELEEQELLQEEVRRLQAHFSVVVRRLQVQELLQEEVVHPLLVAHFLVVVDRLQVQELLQVEHLQQVQISSEVQVQVVAPGQSQS